MPTKPSPQSIEPSTPSIERPPRISRWLTVISVIWFFGFLECWLFSRHSAPARLTGLFLSALPQVCYGCCRAIGFTTRCLPWLKPGGRPQKDSVKSWGRFSKASFFPSTTNNRLLSTKGPHCCTIRLPRYRWTASATGGPRRAIG